MLELLAFCTIGMQLLTQGNCALLDGMFPQILIGIN
jgi:hypothetical protein